MRKAEAVKHGSKFWWEVEIQGVRTCLTRPIIQLSGAAYLKCDSRPFSIKGGILCSYFSCKIFSIRSQLTLIIYIHFTFTISYIPWIGRFDSEFYTTLKAEYETAQGNEQKRLKKKEIESEEKKRKIEEIIEKIEKLILQHTKEFNQCFNYAVQNLRNNNPYEAIKCLKESLKIESKIKDLFKQMKELEGDLKKLTKRGFRFLRKEKKKYA